MRDDAYPPITARMLLEAYAAGIFPMADGAEADDIFWVDPKTRGIIPLHGLHISRSLRKTIRKGEFEVHFNRNFDAVVGACAAREETWINDEILSLYQDLHRTGYAHSVEVWINGELSGGLYGVALGGAFFGESMFSLAPDTQFVTEHLERMGAVEISRAAYHLALEGALSEHADFWRQPKDISPHSVLQLKTQTS